MKRLIIALMLLLIGGMCMTQAQTSDTKVDRKAEKAAKKAAEEAELSAKYALAVVLLSQYLRSNDFCVSAGVTFAYPFLPWRDTVLYQGIVVSVVAVLVYFERLAHTVVSNLPAAGVYEVRDGGEGSHIVVDDNAAGVHARADTVVEHQWYTHVYEALKVVTC